MPSLSGGVYMPMDKTVNALLHGTLDALILKTVAAGPRLPAAQSAWQGALPFYFKPSGLQFGAAEREFGRNFYSQAKHAPRLPAAMPVALHRSENIRREVLGSARFFASSPN